MAKKLTITQIKSRLKKANIVLDETIDFEKGYDGWEVEVFIESTTQEGVADDEKTDALSDKVMDALKWECTKTGYGAWIFRQNMEDKGEWCSTNSKWHY